MKPPPLTVEDVKRHLRELIALDEKTLTSLPHDSPHRKIVCHRQATSAMALRWIGREERARE